MGPRMDKSVGISKSHYYAQLFTREPGSGAPDPLSARVRELVNSQEFPHVHPLDGQKLRLGTGDLLKWGPGWASDRIALVGATFQDLFLKKSP